MSGCGRFPDTELECSAANSAVFSFGGDAHIMIVPKSKQWQQLLHVILGAWQHLAHQQINGRINQQPTALFGLVIAFLLLLAFERLLQVKFLLTSFKTCADFQLLLFELAKLIFKGGKLLFQASAVPGRVLTDQGPDSGNIGKPVGVGYWPLTLSPPARLSL